MSKRLHFSALLFGSLVPLAWNPVAPSTFSILELGSPKDSIELIATLHGSKHSNQTPDDRDFSKALDYEPAFKSESASSWFPGFDGGVPPEAWMRAWASASPSLVYLSGHFDSENKLYNESRYNGEPGAAAISFEVKKDGGKAITVEHESGETTLDGSALAKNCKAVVMVGCSLIGLEEDRETIQSFFSIKGEQRVVVLGFHKACPKSGQEHLVRRFAEALAADESWTQDELVKAWMTAASSWEEVSAATRRHVAYLASDGKAYALGADGKSVGID